LKLSIQNRKISGELLLRKHGDDRYKTSEELATAIRQQARYAIDKIEE
jgi:putative cell wall-binding protein